MKHSRPVLAAALLAGCFGRTSADVPAGPLASPPAVPPCTTNQACSDAHGGAPFLCQATTKACVPLSTAACPQVLAEREDWLDDGALVVGLVYDQTPGSVGAIRTKAAEFARREIRTALAGGLPARSRGGPSHPLVFVACDESLDPAAATHHLVDTLGVPAIVGYERREDLVAAAAVAVPAGVAIMGAGVSAPTVSMLPGGSPRLLWRTTPSAALLAGAIGQAIGWREVGAAHARPGATSAPVRVALVHPAPSSSGGSDETAVVAAVTESASFNGSTFAENVQTGAAQTFAVDAQAPSSALPAALAAFEPDVVVLVDLPSGARDVVRPLEAAWPSADPRPLYLASADLLGPDLTAATSSSADLRGRVLLAELDSTTAELDTFRVALEVDQPDLLHAIDDRQTALAAATTYDASYVLAAVAGAAIAAGTPLSGAGLSSGIARLDAGPSYLTSATDLAAVLGALDAGGAVSLRGYSGPLGFDGATGGVQANVAFVCPWVDAAGNPAPSGAVFHSASSTFDGTVDCSATPRPSP